MQAGQRVYTCRAAKQKGQLAAHRRDGDTVPVSLRSLFETFAVLRPDQSVAQVDNSPGIYAELDARFDNFKGHVLVAAHAFGNDWPTWEVHPNGDEIVVLLDGTVTLVMRKSDGDETVTLTEPGSYVVIPKNTWHTARVGAPSRMLFITPGEGTDNRETPAAPGD